MTDHPLKIFGPPTRYAALSPGKAAAVVLAVLIGIGWCLWITATERTEPMEPPADTKIRDGPLFRRIVERVHSGEGYYSAWGSELRSRGYPTRSVLNWRLPLFAWLNGKLPGLAWGQFLLCALALATVLMSYWIMRAESGVPVAMATVTLVGLAIAPCLMPNVYLATELWAGTLITFSICAYTNQRWRLGVAAGLFALFLRELALPYCLLCLALAYWEKRRAEVYAWVAGLALFAIYLGLHWAEVARHHTPGDLAHSEGWVRFGGTAFVLTTVAIHILLAEFPPWTWAIYLPLSLLGLAAWQGPMGRRVGPTACVYLATFAVVGLPFNNYWGLIDAPLLAFGFVRSPACLRDLALSIACRFESHLPDSDFVPVKQSA